MSEKLGQQREWGSAGRRALIVNAVDDEAAAFWRRRGIMPSKDNALVLFLSLGDIAASLRTASET